MEEEGLRKLERRERRRFFIRKDVQVPNSKHTPRGRGSQFFFRKKLTRRKGSQRRRKERQRRKDRD